MLLFTSVYVLSGVVLCGKNQVQLFFDGILLELVVVVYLLLFHYILENMFIIQKARYIVFAVLAVLFITSLGFIAVSAETTMEEELSVSPESTSTSVPGGEEAAGEVGPVGVTNELEVARDVMWDALLNDADDSLSVALHGVHVLLSGVVELDGKRVLYVGVDEEDYTDDAKMTALKKEVEKRFPNVPVYIHATEGVKYQQSKEPLFFRSEPKKAIPDNTDTQSVSSLITIPSRSGALSTQVISDIQVSVDVTHNYISDLKIDLVAPNGTVVVLHDNVGGNAKNINRTYDTHLDGLIGTTMSGNWRLRVGDYNWSNTGTLNAWNIRVETRDRGQTSASSTVIFSDDFSGGLVKWTSRVGHNDTGWRAMPHTEGDVIYGFGAGNIVAEAEECDSICVITTSAPIDLTAHNQAYLSFNRWVDTALDLNEYLKVEVSNDGGVTYRQLDKWDSASGDNDDKWHRESYTLTAADLRATDFKIRFVTRQSSSAEQTAIDNVLLSSDSTETIAPIMPGDDCFTIGSRSTDGSVMGGDRVFNRVPGDDAAGFGCSTLTLGGVETVGGKKGFVMSAHAVDRENLEQTGGLVAASLKGSTFSKYLGRVDRMPFVWKDNVTGGSEKESVILADAAFVEYPYSNVCSRLIAEKSGVGVVAQKVQNLCFQYEYIDRVQSKKIRGDKEIYSVVGSEVVEIGDRVRISGAVQGELAGSTTAKGSVAGELLYSDKVSGAHSYVFLYTGSLMQDGDSGAPVYTEPNAENEVEIVGLHIGSMKHPSREFVFGVFSSWRDVQGTLGLRPLGSDGTEEYDDAEDEE